MNKKIMLLIALLIPTPLIPKQSFVAKKKKTESVSTLKNNCCDACTDLLHTSAKLIETIATQQIISNEKNDSSLMEVIKDLAIIQQLMLDKIRSIIEGTQDCFFTNATKTQLSHCCEKTKTCHEELLTLKTKIKNETYKVAETKALHTHICQYIEYIETL
ncbi:MAG: hypothetical protein P4L31_06000 [Candidatus Babeliales bacterium]|nr:hypothetical protein [Candidatus Babeliales bacterium]